MRQTVVLFILIFTTGLASGCSAQITPDSPPEEPSSPPPDGSCVAMSELDCTDSEECTLVHAEETREYSCREAEEPCETGFRQRGGDAEACEAKTGCRFVPGRCYCPPDVTCICGGGPPPQCVEG